VLDLNNDSTDTQHRRPSAVPTLTASSLPFQLIARFVLPFLDLNRRRNILTVTALVVAKHTVLPTSVATNPLHTPHIFLSAILIHPT